VDRVLVGLLAPLIRAVTGRVLGHRLGADAASAVSAAARAGYRRRAAVLPDEPTLGARVMVRLAALSASWCVALAEHGLSAEEARRRSPGGSTAVWPGFPGC